MPDIITTWDYPIKIVNFWITEDSVEQAKEENNIDEDNRIIIWLIIWKIRQKFIKLHRLSDKWIISTNIKSKEIIDIIDALKLPLEGINENFKSFEELWIHIFQKYNFTHIRKHFLCHEVWMTEFLEASKNFLDTDFYGISKITKDTPKKTDQIINSIQEL